MEANNLFDDVRLGTEPVIKSDNVQRIFLQIKN